MTIEPGGTMGLLLIKATLLLLLALGISAALQRASAGMRHLVWVAAIVALLTLPALVAWSPIELALLPAESAPRAFAAVPGEQPPSLAAQNAAAPNELLPESGLPMTGPAAASSMTPWQIAAAIWGIVALAVLLWLAMGFLNVRRILRRAELLESREWTGPLFEIADRLGIATAPRLYRSADVKMPFACGLFTPSIVLPAGADAWDADRRRAVLMHELAHIRRRDLLGHTLGRLACAAYWFHPLVWTAARRMRVESERACDDLALTCGLRPAMYAEHLLDIVTGVGKTRTPAIAIPMAHRREFEGRMLAILDPEVRRGVGRRQTGALVFSLLAVVLFIGAAAPVQRPAVAGLTSSAGSDTDRVALRGDSAPRATLPARDAERFRLTTQPRDQGMQPLIQPEAQPNVQLQAQPLVQDGQPGVQPDRGLDAVLGALLPEVQQARDERPVLLMTVLRSDSAERLRRTAAWGLSRYVDRGDVATALATALRRDRSDAVREMSAWALGSGGDREEAVLALGEALRRDASAAVREMVAWALGNVAPEKSADVLTQALGDQSPAVRQSAMWALGNAGPSAAPAAVISALTSDDKRTRLLAAWTLFRIADERTVPSLEQAVARETDRETQLAYIRALGAIGERSAPALARLIDSPDAEVRAVVVEALAGKGSGPWPWPWPRPRPWP